MAPEDTNPEPRGEDALAQPSGQALTAPEAERDLDHFIADFFLPIVQDRQISAVEETPLCLGYRLYRLDTMDPDRVAASLREALARVPPAAEVRPGPGPDGPEVWARLCAQQMAVTWGDLHHLRTWFLRDDADPFAAQNYPSRGWRIDAYASTSRGMLSQFQKLLDEATREPAPAPAVAPPASEPVLTFVSPLTQAQVESARDALWRDAFEIVGRLDRNLRETPMPGLAFDGLRDNVAEQAVFLDEASLADRDIWFVGDIHGDFLGLEASLDAIRQQSADPTLIFLGDFIDRGPCSPEVLLRIWSLLLERPDRICILAGNHTDGLGVQENGLFRSSVAPSDFVDLLNTMEGNLLWQVFGNVALTLGARVPRALFFPDGLLAAHGGVPLSDLHAGLLGRLDLNHADCLQDFVWTRAHPTAPIKLPNRYSRGSEFGFKNFDAFCQLMAERLHFPVARMIRGHTHEEARHALYGKYQLHPMLTINNMCHRMPDEGLGPFERTPCIARWRRGELPQVVRIQIAGAVIRALCPGGADEQ